MKSTADSPRKVLVIVGLALAGLVALLHWYDTRRLNEQTIELEEHVCASLNTQQTSESLERVASGYFPEDGPSSTPSVSVEPLRGILGSYRHPSWRLSGTAYFGRGGRWWLLRPWGEDTLSEINDAPDPIVNAPRSVCSVQPGGNRNEVDVVMPFRFGKVETAILVRAQRKH
ncbi:MAG: hypothetical protein AAGF92_02035 [Myxococcota bacterium]